MLMNAMKIMVLAGACLSAVWLHGAPPPPAIEIPIVPAAPDIDGNLDEQAWAAALPVTNFVVISVDGWPSAANVSARLMRDAAWLYVGFDIRHPDPRSIQPKAELRDEKVQDENCVKVAFDPGTEGKLWYHIRLSAGNVIADQRNTDKGAESGWNLPLRSATRLTAAGWQAELALPFSMMLGVGDPARASINLVAHVFTPLRDQQFVVVGEECAVAAWAPTSRAWWQEPEKFVPIRGLDQAEFKAAFLPMLENVTVGGYAYTNGGYQYPVSGKIRNFSSQTGLVHVQINDLPAAGTGGEVSAAVPVPAGQDVDWSVSVPVREIVRRNLRVSLKSNAGRAVDMRVIASPAALNLFSAALDRNYYTDEPEARAHCRIGLPEHDLQNMRLSARTAAGVKLGEIAGIAPDIYWAFPIDKLQPGRHEIRLELLRADGALVADESAVLVKRVANPGREWKIDRFNRTFLNNGQPYFPFGVVDSAGSAFHLKIIADIGFNAVHQWSRTDNIDAYMQLAQSNGLNVTLTDHSITRFDDRTRLRDPKKILPPAHLELLNKRLGGTDGSFIRMKGVLIGAPFSKLPIASKSALFMEYLENNIPDITAAVSRGREYPNLMGWFIMDEPVLETGAMPVGQAFYKLLHDLDGYHPVFLNYSSSIPNSPDAVDWSDALGTDPYWVPGYGGEGAGRNSINFMAAVVAMTKKRADEVRSVTWTIPMLEYWSGCTKRALTGAEQKAQTYLALIHGTKGLFYFRYPFQSREMLDTMRDLAAQMRELGPVCLQPEVRQEISYTPGSLSPLQGKFTDIQARLMRHPAGGYVLLAVNTAYHPVDAEITIAGLSPQAEKVTRMFGDPTHAVRGDTFADKFTPMSTRAYRIPARAITEPVAVKISMQPHPELAVRETAYARTGRVDMRNRLPNPSYEEATIAGWPDYHKKVWGARDSLDSLIGGSERNWGLSEEQPFHGKQSLLLATTSAVDQVIAYTDIRVENDRDRDYVFSAYLRADRDGVNVDLLSGAGAGRLEKKCMVNREWQRYHIVFKMPAGGFYVPAMVILRRNEQPARLWVDALQFEPGGAPTEFEP